MINKVNILSKDSNRDKDEVINSDKESITDKIDNTSYIDHNNDYLKSLIGSSRNEINLLKGYINRLNKEIRKNMNMEIPLLENIQETTHKDEYESLFNFFNESINRLINPEYLNPILSIYDNHIINLESEIKHYKGLCLKYENAVSGLVKENSNVREEILIKNNEMRELLKFKLESGRGKDRDNLITNLSSPLDHEFLTSLEERNNLLSRENEILAVNYQKINKELIDFSLTYSEKHKECLEKIQMYETFNEEFNKVNHALDNALLNGQVCESKVYELSEIITRLEIEYNNLKAECERYRLENISLVEANSFYKNYIQKISIPN